ncbi:hypothetical protein BH09ACT4_BH09ACT4_13740 [soil metagenome]
MTDATSTVPPGWYPDANAPGGQRWWDGTQWTEHVAPQAYQMGAEAKAPDGTKTGTVWIWLVALLPLLSLVALFSIDITGYMHDVVVNGGSGSSALSLYTSPAYLITLVLGWGSSIAIIVFSFLDWRTLKARGVPAPFHWAFSFLLLASAGIAYPIGRSVVVKRRAGGSMAPMWVAIAVYVIIIIASIVWVFMIMNQVFAMMPRVI